MKEEQDWRMMQLPNQVSHGDRKRKAKLVKMVATTQLRLAWKQRMKEVQKNGMDWIWI